MRVFLVAAFVMLSMPFGAWAAPVCQAPPTFSSLYYGLDPWSLRDALSSLFAAAFKEKGTEGQQFVSLLQQLNKSYELNLDTAPWEGEIPEAERARHGLRDFSPGGRRSLSSDIASALENFPQKVPKDGSVGLLAGKALDAMAAACIPEERVYNEHIAQKVAGSQTARALSHGALRWLTRLRDAQCIGETFYAPAAAALAAETRDALPALLAEERIRAMAVLVHAGFGRFLTEDGVREVVDSVPGPRDAWGTVEYKNLDVYLAGAYVVAHVLAQAESPKTPANILRQTIEKESRSAATAAGLDSQREG